MLLTFPADWYRSRLGFLSEVLAGPGPVRVPTMPMLIETCEWMRVYLDHVWSRLSWCHTEVTLCSVMINDFCYVLKGLWNSILGVLHATCQLEQQEWMDLCTGKIDISCGNSYTCLIFVGYKAHGHVTHRRVKCKSYQM